MRTLILTLIGILLLFALVASASAVNRRRHARVMNGPRAFVFLWLGISIAHLYIGVVREGYPLLMELGIHAIIFGIPALLAWYISRRSLATGGPPLSH